MLKSDILRQGIDLSQAAMDNLKKRDDLLWKGFHLFSYDFNSTKVYSEKIPWMLRLEDGCNIQVRTNDSVIRDTLQFTSGLNSKKRMIEEIVLPKRLQYLINTIKTIRYKVYGI